MHKGFAGLMLSLLLLPQALLAGESVKIDNSILTMRVDGELVIDPAGKVLDYRITTPIKPEMQQLLGKSVRNWTFHPVKVTDDGRPANAKTGMRITLAAQAAGTGYRVSVDNVTFRTLATADKPADPDHDGATPDTPSIVPKNLRGGGYPKGLMRAGVEGAVLLSLKLSPEGAVEDIIAVQSSLYNVRGRPQVLAEARKLFETNSISFARRWKFEVRPGSSPLTTDDLTVVIPVQYTMQGSSADAAGQWRAELRSEKTLVPWLIDASSLQSIGISDLDANEMLPLASEFRVPEGVVGKTL